MKDAKQNFNKSSWILELEETHLLHQTEITFKILVTIVPYIYKNLLVLPAVARLWFKFCKCLECRFYNTYYNFSLKSIGIKLNNLLTSTKFLLDIGNMKKKSPLTFVLVLSNQNL